MNIFVSGNVIDDLNFEYGEGAYATYGCGTTLMGEFWYFGSGQQVSFFSQVIWLNVYFRWAKLLDAD